MKYSKSEELGSTHCWTEVQRGIEKHEPIVYSENGSRSRPAEVWLKEIEGIAPKIGITRVADISNFGLSRYPVFQSTRPNTFVHTASGQNSGAQGKGPTITQAKVSCIMETMESYCAEPKLTKLIRGSYEKLSRNYPILHPKYLSLSYGAKPVDERTILMWNESFLLEHNSMVLVPAESTYFPFFPDYYSTQNAFGSSGNGLASGSSYLEAINHALYEIIERYYLCSANHENVQVQAFHEDEIDCIEIEKIQAELGADFQIQFYSIMFNDLRNIPMVVCSVAADDEQFMGFGCFSSCKVAFERALSEAMQSYCTAISGGREDLEAEQKQAEKDKHIQYPNIRSMHMSDYKEKIPERNFDHLREEMDYLVKWIHQAGFEFICCSNLTRVGIEVPVVRIMVPGMEAFHKHSSSYSINELVRMQYGEVGT